MSANENEVKSWHEEENSSLEMEQEIHLRDFFRDIKKDDSLQNRILNLQSENGHLRQELDETRENWKSYKDVAEKWKRDLEESRRVAESVFSERLKCLTAECANLTERLTSAELEIKERRDRETSRIDAETLTDDYLEIEEKVRALEEKLARTREKLYRANDTCGQLRQQVNTAQKLLCSEVGEDVTIASLSSRASTGWRGRAEQLQQSRVKICQLQAKLREKESSTCFPVCVEEKRLEKSRKSELEVALENSQKKSEAARARIRVLEKDLSGARANLALLNEKRMHDEQLIEALNTQLGAVEEKCRERERTARREKERAEQTCKELRDEIANLNARLELFRKKLHERETEIQNFRRDGDTRRRLEPGSDLEKTPRKSTSCQIAEAERDKLFELVTILNQRLDKERSDSDRISELLRQERNKSAKLETKLQRLETERAGISRINRAYRTSSFRFSEKIDENTEKEKMRFKIELLEEECLALRTRLETLRQDKATDLAIFKKTIEHTRQALQEASV